MTVLAFSMSGEPRGKGRPRVDTRGVFPRMHTDQKTIEYERSISAVARKAMAGRPPFTGPTSVSLRFRVSVPKAATKSRRAAMLAGEIAPTTKPDIDNAAKACLDGMAVDAIMRRKLLKLKRDGAQVDLDQARIVFRDDAQITRLFVTKVYAEQPGVDVRVEAFAAQTGEAA
jgi:Holliday junction resolvase RusA-like endonuclease